MRRGVGSWESRIGSWKSRIGSGGTLLPILPPTPDSRFPTRYSLALYALLLAAVGLVFWQTAAFDFINYDDHPGVCDNPRVTRPLTLGGIKAVFTERHVESWAPLTCLSHMLVWHLLGHGPAAHHLTNVLLHAAVGGAAVAGPPADDRPLWPSAWRRPSSPCIRSAPNRWPG